MTFISRLEVHTTCRDCGELMLVTRADDTTHPTCQTRPTRLESLATGWLSCVLAGDHESAVLTQKEIDELDSRPPRLGGAALRYAEWDWPVFPLRRNSKIPATSHGFKDADPQHVTDWWGKNLRYNIGLATGHLFDVIDIDPKNSGVHSFLSLLDKYALPPVHGIAVTASGGLHLYVTATGKGNFAGLYPGIDYRGNGGYVVAPPSWLGTPGTRYTWLIPPSPVIKEREF